MNKNKWFWTVSIIALALTACGGGGDDRGSSIDRPTSPKPDPAPAAGTAEGLWRGTTDSNRSLTGLVLSNGFFYFLYSVAGSPNLVAGVVQGNMTYENNQIQSTNGRDFHLEGQQVTAVTVRGGFSPGKQINGSVSYSREMQITFEATYDAEYDKPSSIATISGNYTGRIGTSVGTEDVVLTIDDNGGITGTGTSSCAATGRLKSRKNGSAFDLSLSFGGSPCLFANQTLSGAAYYDRDTGTLYAVAPNNSRSDGLIFLGRR